MTFLQMCARGVGAVHFVHGLIRNEAPSRDPVLSVHLSTGSRGKGLKELFDKLVQT